LDALVISGTSLDKGELTSIALYKYLKADYLLIDERAGRKIAKINGIKIIGTLGVLIEAKRKGIIPSIKPQINILRSSQIYFAQNLLDHALRMVGETCHQQ
jgi:predicted nucleic acid-binding protein